MTAGGSHYDYDVDVTQEGSSGSWLVGIAGRDRRVLDLGCAAGALARVLVDRGCAVVGLDIDPDAAKLAELVCERVVVGDMDEIDLELVFENDHFDVILAGDVLEHLRDPRPALRALRGLLKPGGYLAISVPNVAHGSIRLALLHGDFPRAELGLLDLTHVQFLTRDNLQDLLAETGWTPAFIDGTIKPIAASEVPYPDDELTRSVLSQISADPLAEVYQHLVVAYPVASTDDLDPVASLLVDARADREAQLARVAAIEAHVATLTAELAAQQAAYRARELEDLTRQKTVETLTATVAELRFTERLLRVDTRLHSDREAERLNGALGYERSQKFAAEEAFAKDLELAEEKTAEVAEVVADRDSELAEIHGSRLWRSATLYRRVRAGLSR